MITIVKRVLDQEHRSSLIELVVILSMTSILFYLLETNMMVFGFFVYAGLFWIVRDVSNTKLAIVTGLVGGLVGFLTEYWGCGQHYWSWVVPCQSLWMINGMEDGFPVEVVVAYAGSGFWITKLSLKLFAEEHRDTALFYANRGYLTSFYARLTTLFLIVVTGITVLCIEPVFIQSSLLLTAGLSVFTLLSRSAQKIVGSFAIVVGLVGFFFENFATGFFPAFAVWRYNHAAHTGLAIPDPIIGVAPITAFFAYVGVGLLLFGLSFLLNYALTDER